MKVRFFARCREIVGEKVQELEVEEGMRLGDLIELLLTRYPGLREVRLLVSLNHTYASLAAELKEDDELAVFPPVSGG